MNRLSQIIDEYMKPHPWDSLLNWNLWISVKRWNELSDMTAFYELICEESSFQVKEI